MYVPESQAWNRSLSCVQGQKVTRKVTNSRPDLKLSEKGENSRRNTFGEIWASPESNLVTKKCALWSEGSRDRECRSKYIEIAFLLHQSPNPTFSVLSFRTTVKLVSYMRTVSVVSRPTVDCLVDGLPETDRPNQSRHPDRPTFFGDLIKNSARKM